MNEISWDIHQKINLPLFSWIKDNEISWAFIKNVIFARAGGKLIKGDSKVQAFDSESPPEQAGSSPNVIQKCKLFIPKVHQSMRQAHQRWFKSASFLIPKVHQSKREAHPRWFKSASFWSRKSTRAGGKLSNGYSKVQVLYSESPREQAGSSPKVILGFQGFRVSGF